MILVIRTAMVIERTSILLFLVLSGVRCRMHTPEDSLQMREGSPFKIALFADLHFGENAWTDWGPRQDLNSVRVMSDVLDKEKPDFVIYLGDIITANNIMIKNASLYWDQAVSPAKDRRIPWSIVFGNHDDAPFHWPTEWFSETGIPQLNCSLTGDEECSFRPTTRLELIKNETDNNSILSHSKKGPQSLWPSVSNYALKLSSSRNPDKAAAFLYFLDSGGGSYPEVISKSQLKWFKEKAEELNPDSSVAEILFWHIPSKIFKKVAPTLKKRNIKCTGSMFSEEVTPQEAEMGIMKVLEERTSIKAVFVGHNHGLDWCCPYKKMWLCFARHTGYGGYGNWSRGARILEIINEKPFSLKSWIKMEDGKTHSEVLLTNQNDISRK